MGELEVERLAELANRSIGEPAVGAPDLTVEHAAGRVDERTDAAVPGLEQHDAEAFISRGQDQQLGVGKERGPQRV